MLMNTLEQPADKVIMVIQAFPAASNSLAESAALSDHDMQKGM